jgi:hypothetical protein
VEESPPIFITPLSLMWEELPMMVTKPLPLMFTGLKIVKESFSYCPLEKNM